MYGEGGVGERFLCCPFVDLSDAYIKAADDEDGEIVVVVAIVI